MGAIAPAATAETRSRVRCVRDATGLAAIRRPTVELALWQRRPPADVALLRDRLDGANLPHLRLDAVAVDAVAPTLSASLGNNAARLDALIADIGMLARLFGRIRDRQVVRLRLEPVTGDACSKFHVDRVHARLLTTYLGPGTEWLETEPDGSDRIRRFEPFAVGLLKGSLWPGSRGCAHRSPPIAGTGQHRLLLCIDDGPAG